MPIVLFTTPPQFGQFRTGAFVRRWFMLSQGSDCSIAMAVLLSMPARGASHDETSIAIGCKKADQHMVAHNNFGAKATEPSRGSRVDRPAALDLDPEISRREDARDDTLQTGEIIWTHG